ncbi:MAG: hypothetical protein L0Z70_11465, partial [Chloroflexi bacterium]|nr:hypothetical protein [Chloroflexota bacterium]
DVVHGVYIDGYQVSLSADPGQPQRVSFTADQAGSFRLRCSVTCGPLHPFMSGKLVVAGGWQPWRLGTLAALIAAAVLVNPLRGRRGVGA